MKRSKNKENLMKQLKDVNQKILKLQIQRAGIEKSLKRIQTSVEYTAGIKRMDL